LADQAGGEAPKPLCPDTSFLEEIRLTVGNEQLLALYNRRDDLTQSIDTWTEVSEQIAKRWPTWIILKHLMQHAEGIPEAEVIKAQLQTIEQQRQLLVEPDLIGPLVATLTQRLRDELNQLKTEWDKVWTTGQSRLGQDENWNSLEPEQKHELRKPHGLIESAMPKIQVENTEAVLNTLDAIPLTTFKDRIAAMPGRFDQILFDGAKLMEPQAQEMKVPRRVLKTEAEIEVWINEVKSQLKTALKKGPIVIR